MIRKVIKTMDITDVNNQIAAAMKRKDVNILATLRMLKAEITYKMKQLKKEEQLDAEAYSGAVQRTLKKYREELESILQYTPGNSAKISDLQESITLLEGFLPAQLTKEDVAAAVQKAVSESDNLGAIMGALSKTLRGKADLSEVRQMVQEAMNSRK
jgi:uncharacterized protein YqeY